jgi:hypothetical protein
VSSSKNNPSQPIDRDLTTKWPAADEASWRRALTRIISLIELRIFVSIPAGTTLHQIALPISTHFEFGRGGERVEEGR